MSAIVQNIRTGENMGFVFKTIKDKISAFNLDKKTSQDFDDHHSAFQWLFDDQKVPAPPTFPRKFHPHGWGRTFTLRAAGTKYFSDEGDSGIKWYLLDADECRGLTDDDLIHAFNMTSYYGGVGRYFARVGYVVRARKRVLLRQSWGYDI